MRHPLASAVRIVPLLLAACAPVPQEPETPVSSAVTSASTPPAASTPPIAPAPTNAYHAPAGALPRLSVATRGTLLDVTFENAGTAPVYLYTHMNADTDQYDWITVELTDATAHVRELHFTAARDKSAPQNVELAPGQRVTETIDLAAWAARPGNGKKPIGPGTYKVAVFYDSSRETYAWAGKLSASTVLVVK